MRQSLLSPGSQGHRNSSPHGFAMRRSVANPKLQGMLAHRDRQCEASGLSFATLPQAASQSTAPDTIAADEHL